MNTSQYKISHNWGDPREPEFENGLKVSFLYYNDGSINLRFRVYGIKSANDDSVAWFVEEPKNLRDILGANIGYRSIISERAINFLKNIPSEENWRNNGRAFSNVEIDGKLVSSRISHKLQSIKIALLPITEYLPSLRTSAIIFVSFFVLYFFGRHNGQSASTIRVLCGAIALGSLAFDLYKEYKTHEVLCLMIYARHPQVNYKLEALKKLFEVKTLKYAITLLVIFIFLFENP